METPIISIIIPVYKTEPYLDRCMRSVLDGEFKEIEVILVDDGSPNGYECDKYAEQDARVKVIHQENKGVACARNEALRHAAALWIGFADSDDWVHPHMYQRLYNLARKHNADIASCGMHECSESNTVVQLPDETDKDEIIMDGQTAFKNFLLSNPITTSVLWDKIYARHLFQSIAFPEIKLASDAGLIYKLYHRAAKVAHINAPYYYYFIRSNSLTTSTFSPAVMDKMWVAREIEKYIEANCPDYTPYAKCFLVVTAIRIAVYFNAEAKKGHAQHYNEVRKILWDKKIGNASHLALRHKLLIFLYRYVPPLFYYVWRRRLKQA